MLDIRLNLGRLEKAIIAYEATPVEEGKILFYGDSSFTQWNPKYGNPKLEEAFADENGVSPVINHGFGTSTAEEQLYYYPRVVKPWKPKALVLQTFGNDLDAGYNVEDILALWIRLIAYARRDMPGIRFYLCDVRPLTRTVKDLNGGMWLSRVKEFNKLLARFCEENEDCTLVRHADCAALFEEGEVGNYKKPRLDIFKPDEVHYNPAGYAIYADFFREVLKDVL